MVQGTSVTFAPVKMLASNCRIASTICKTRARSALAARIDQLLVPVHIRLHMGAQAFGGHQIHGA